MLKSLLPDQYVESIYDINLNELKKKGIKGVITDLDNTLVEWDRPDATPEVRQWLSKLQDAGMSVTVVSNNSEKKGQGFLRS